MLGYRVLLGEVHDSPIVLVEAHRGEERRLAVALSDGQGGNVAVVFHVLLHLVYDRVRIPLAAQHVVQVGAIVELRLLGVDDDGAVTLHEHGTQQRHRRLDLGGIDKGVRIHDAAEHAHNHVVLHHRFGDAVEVAVQPVGLAHVRHDALAGFEPSQDLAIAFLSIRIVNALFERGDGNVGHPEGRSLVPRVQKISEHLAFGVDIGRHLVELLAQRNRVCDEHAVDDRSHDEDGCSENGDGAWGAEPAPAERPVFIFSIGWLGHQVSFPCSRADAHVRGVPPNSIVCSRPGQNTRLPCKCMRSVTRQRPHL